MKKVLLVLVASLVFWPRVLTAVPGYLSPVARISLLTATPGGELYSVFGHSALRVYDPESGLDEVYNYGTFDFDTPNFYLKFVRGKLYYKLTVVPYRFFLREYQYEGRGVSEQILNLSSEEIHDIYSFLQINRQPGNEYYLYDFFYDNCATRIRDIIEDKLAPDWAENPVPGVRRSFRNMLKPYLGNKPWAGFGVDLLLGLRSDRKPSPWHYMFLPDEMFIAFSQARLSDGRVLVKECSQVLDPIYTPKKVRVYPQLMAWLLLLLGLLSLLKIRIAKVFDRVFFSALGLWGMVLLFLWFFSNHTALHCNLNLLWAIPTHLFFIYKGNMIYPIGIPRYYFKLVFLLNLFTLLFWLLLPQGFHPAVLPIVLLSAVKSFLHGYGDAWKRFPFMRRRR